MFKYCLFAYVLGVVTAVIFNKFVKIDISIKKNEKVAAKRIKMTSNKPVEIQEIETLLNEIRKNGKLPINLSPVVLKSLLEISKCDNWENILDSDTKQNLHKIYKKWQKHLKAESNTDILTTSSQYGFETYWEGTIEEYKEALEKGLIDENTKIKLFQYSDETYSLDENGNWIENT